MFHRTRTNLPKGFLAAYLMGRDKRNVSAKFLQRELGMLSISSVSIGILWLGLAGVGFAAKAQEGPGDLDAGRALARQVCSPCHSIERGPATPRMFEIAPDFQTIADTPGMTATALNAFLLTSHPKMPNFILSREQSADVITYILSLRTHPRPGQGNR